MHIKSIEDTPNYNTIKINLSENVKIINQIRIHLLKMGNLILLIDYLISKE